MTTPEGNNGVTLTISVLFIRHIRRKMLVILTLIDLAKLPAGMTISCNPPLSSDGVVASLTDK